MHILVHSLSWGASSRPVATGGWRYFSPCQAPNPLREAANQNMLQLSHGLYKEVQDDFRGDGSAGVLQRAGKSSADGARRVGHV